MNDRIIKGTDAVIKFDLSGDAALDMSKLGTCECHATYPGGGVVKSGDALTIDVEHKTICCVFSQQETLRLPKDKTVRIVLICMVDGMRRETRPVLECVVEDTPRRTVRS